MKANHLARIHFSHLAIRGLVVLTAGWAVAACAVAPTPKSITDAISATNRPEEFAYCADGGCYREILVALDAAEWKRVRDLFAPRPGDAAAERASIAEAVGLLERIIGPATGTAGDRGRNGEPFDGGQLDCFSETTNTSNFVGMMFRDGLLHFHRPREPRLRGLRFHGLNPYIHATAVIEETATGQAFAMDSWFFDNGTPAAVVPLKDWLNGWQP